MTTLSPLLSFLSSKYEMATNPDLSIRITLPYQDCSGIIHKWFSRCSNAICYEHEQDDEITKTHVHLALFNLDCKTEALKRMWPDVPGSGNQFWSFTTTKDRALYLTYMSKGSLYPKLSKGYTDEEIDEQRNAWVTPKKEDSDPSEFMIKTVLLHYDHYTRATYLEHYRYEKQQETDTIFHSGADYARFLFEEIRTTTLRSYYRMTRKAPHGTQYKLVAASAFLRVSEKFDFLDAAFGELKKSWY